MLECKCLNLDEYITYICDLHSPIDEIRLVILARMFHFHIGIVMADKYWTTKCDHNLHACKILLGWYGKMQFKCMRWIVRDPYDLRSHLIPPPNLSPSALPQPEPAKEPIDPEPELEFQYNLQSRCSAKPQTPPEASYSTSNSTCYTTSQPKSR